jgi:UDP-N-acetylglucosamine/UDP-N-acetylgalactosamine 4-epimerase
MTAYDDLKIALAASPKTWLITGVAGFIGSHLLETLLKLGQRVVGLDNFSTGFKKNLDEVQSLVTSEQWAEFNFMYGDIRNLPDCYKAFETRPEAVDYVLHQAALGSVPRSLADPATTNDTNVSGFVNILTAAKDHKVKRFVFASSSSVYGDLPDLPKVENKIGTPLSPYALTKSINEQYAKVFQSSYGLSFTGLRYFNVFGPRQNASGEYAAVIPKWIAKMMRGAAPCVNGDGTTSRDFCYIDNAIQANLLAALSSEIKAENQMYNVACGDRTTLIEIHKRLSAELSKHFPELAGSKFAYLIERPGDVRHSLASIDLAKNLLGYQPTHFVNAGIKKTIDWHVAQSTKI